MAPYSKAAPAKTFKSKDQEAASLARRKAEILRAVLGD
jgi:hypothetical protein